MAIAPGIYNTGTATVASGGLTVSFQGVPNLQAKIRPGDRFGGHVGFGIRIAAVGTDTATLAHPWPGAAQTAAPYEIVFTPYDLSYREEFHEIIKRYGRGALPAMAELVGIDGKVPMFTGPNTMTLTDVGTPDPNGNLEALGGLVGVAGSVPVFTGPGTMGLTALTTFARSLLAAEDSTAALGAIGAAPPLGFSPIQQGGGTGQGNNKLRIGWSLDGSGLRAQVDTSDLGKLWSQFDLPNPAQYTTTANIYETNYPFGTFLALNSAQTDQEAYVRNQSVQVRLTNPATSGFRLGGTGSLLSGDWRIRGLLGSFASTNHAFYLVQRVG